MAGLGGSAGFPNKNAGFSDPVKIPSLKMPGRQNLRLIHVIHCSFFGVRKKIFFWLG